MCGDVLQVYDPELVALMAGTLLWTLWILIRHQFMRYYSPFCWQLTSGFLSLQRLMRDFKKIRAEQRTGLEASPNPINIMQWNAVMAGPEDTPWDGGDQPSCMLASCHLLLLLCGANLTFLQVP